MATLERYYKRIGKQYGKNLKASGHSLGEVVEEFIPKENKENGKKGFNLFGKKKVS